MMMFSLKAEDGTGIRRVNVLKGVNEELNRQNELWGEQNHSDGTGDEWWTISAGVQRDSNDENDEVGALTWRGILLEEVYEALAESNRQSLREELMQVAAVALQWAEAIDRGNEGPDDEPYAW